MSKELDEILKGDSSPLYENKGELLIGQHGDTIFDATDFKEALLAWRDKAKYELLIDVLTDTNLNDKEINIKVMERLAQLKETKDEQV